MLGYLKKKPIVVVIRGIPSSGKTTISHLVAQKLPNAYRLTIDNLVQNSITPKNFSHREWRKGRPLAHELAQELLKYLLSKKRMSVVVEEIFLEPHHIRKIESIARDFGARIQIIELETDLEAIRQREISRIRAADIPPFEEILKTIQENPYPSAVKIQTDEKSPEEIANEIIRNLPL